MVGVVGDDALIFMRSSKKSSGDFPTVLYEVLLKRSSVVQGTLSIDEVNDYLDELSRNSSKMYALYLQLVKQIWSY